MKPAYLGVAILALAVVIFGLVYLKDDTAPAEIPASGGHAVVLTADGFVPDSLTIKKGEAVTFSTTRGKLYWPASNLHPSHLEYSDFDPKMPVEPDATWSFTFDKAGEWEYHDHLAPYFTGVIIVTE